jgi:hypothetical protein
MNFQFESLKKYTSFKKLSKDLGTPIGLDAELVTKHVLVAVWDKASLDDDLRPANFAFGFLVGFSFDGDSPKYSVLRVNTYSDDSYVCEYDFAAPLNEDCCPKVFYNNGQLQSVGYLVGAVSNPNTQDYDCLIRTAPFHSECRYANCKASGMVELCDIKLGLDKSVK